MLQLSHQSYPPTRDRTANYHQLSASLITAITSSPYSRYSKLSSLVSQALAHKQRSTVEPSDSVCTISLPPLNAAAVTAILAFLAQGSLPSSSPSSFPKEALLRAFDILGVDFPPGFQGNVNMIETEFVSELAGEDYSRGREDYTSPEVFEAMKVIRGDEGFAISIADSEQARLYATTADANSTNTPISSTIGSPSLNQLSSPPAYDYAHSITGAAYHMPSGAQKSHEALISQPRFHVTLQSTLVAKLSSLLLAYILPEIDTQTQLGLFKGTFILVCDPTEQYSEIHPHQVTTSSRHDVIGGTGYRKVINLCSEAGRATGQRFTQEFLTQHSVVCGIKITLEEELGVPSEEPPPPPSSIPPPPPPPPKKKSWFGLGKTQVQPGSPLPLLTPESLPEMRPYSNCEPRTRVDVNVEDVWVKREVEGLWNTASLKGVVVWIGFHLPQRD